MARTTEEIIQLIETRAAAFPELDEIENNPSRASEWKASKQVIAFAIQSMEEIIDEHKKEVSQLIIDQETGRISWYKDRIKEYQHGDIFSLVNNVITYNEVDPGNRIIAHASIKEDPADGSLIIRVAKGDPLEKLTTEELAGLAVWIKAFKFAGTLTNLGSLDPDPIYYEIDVEVDQSIMNLEGERIDGSADTPVVGAIKDYHRNIGEGGILYLSKVIDAVQAV